MNHTDPLVHPDPRFCACGHHADGHAAGKCYGNACGCERYRAAVEHNVTRDGDFVKCSCGRLANLFFAPRDLCAGIEAAIRFGSSQ